MENKEQKPNLTVLLGAAFLMGISAIGPGFLTQTATFTYNLGADHAFAILISVILALGVQLNIWRIIGISGMRGQDIANKVLPGLGYFIAFLIAIGGFAFNIGNIGGSALGLNALIGMPLMWGYLVCGALSIAIFISKSAKSIIDRLVQVISILMIGIVVVVMFITNPPIGEAAVRTFVPYSPIGDLFFPIFTLLGGTVGGYITFSGGHRLIDAGIQGKENLKKITQSAILGVTTAATMRVFLFLAILGVVSAGHTLLPTNPSDPQNPAAIAFYRGAGNLGYMFFGLVLLAAGITSVIGAAYTSVSFLKTLSKTVMEHERYFIIAFIASSTLAMAVIGNPAILLIIVGFLNGLILPLTLSTILIASRNKNIVGDDYKHPTWLIVLGILIVCTTLYISINAFPSFIQILLA